MLDDLNDDNVLIYAIKSYDKLNYIKSEFTEDYKTFKYVKRLLQKYKVRGELRENLILNHITMIHNAFGVEAGTRLLFFKINEENYSSLKTFLLFSNTMPTVVRMINGKDILSSDIPIDLVVANALRKI